MIGICPKKQMMLIGYGEGDNAKTYLQDKDITFFCKFKGHLYVDTFIVRNNYLLVISTHQSPSQCGFKLL
jgi:hypothetical protein